MKKAMTDQRFDFLDEVIDIIQESIKEQHLEKEEIMEALDYRRR